MRANPVRAKLKAGKTVYGTFAVEFFTPGICQIAANAGAEFILFDMEHGGVGIDTLKAQFAFARGIGIVPFARVPALQYHLVATVLDAGAMGIMVPMIETRAQAEDLAAWCRYRPEGRRGIGFGAGHDDYQRGNVVSKMRAANERTLVIALVESAIGISNIDEIAAVEGVDVCWLGHYDLTELDGHPRCVRSTGVRRRRASPRGRLRRARQGRRIPPNFGGDGARMAEQGISLPRLRHRRRSPAGRSERRARQSPRALKGTSARPTIPLWHRQAARIDR